MSAELPDTPRPGSAGLPETAPPDPTELTETAPAPAVATIGPDETAQLLESLPVVVFRTDAAGTWTYLNPAWATITGHPVDETLGTNFLEYVHPDEREHTIALFMAVVSGGAALCHHQTRYRTRSGGYRWLELHASPEYDEAGQVCANSGTLVDLTAWQVAQRTVEEHTEIAELVAREEAYDDLPLALLVLDGELQLRRATGAARRLLGHPLLAGERFDDLLPRFDLHDRAGNAVAPHWGLLDTALRVEQPQYAELSWRPLDGRPAVWLQTTALPGAGQPPTELTVLLQDVTHLRHAEDCQAAVARLGQRALEAESLDRLFDEAVREVVGVLGTDVAELLEMGPDAQLLLRAHASDPAGWDPGEQATGELTALAEETLLTGSPVMRRRPGGSQSGGRQISSTLSVPIGGRAGPLGVLQTHSTGQREFRAEEVGFLQGVANVVAALIGRREAESAVAHQSLHDPLTGLANRMLLRDRLDQALLRCRRDGQGLALLLIDLDRFREVNDALGHDIGDDVLRIVAARLSGVIRDGDTVARLGADEFVVVLPAVEEPDVAALVAVKVRESIGQGMQLNSHALHLGASVGVAISLPAEDSPTQLLRRADAALDHAKRFASGHWVYQADVDGNRPDRLALLDDLHWALGNGQLFLHYQPKVELVTGRVTSLEALARWQHPREGVVAPDRFVPLAEQGGLVRQLTRTVLATALHQSREWLNAGRQIQVAVNLSPQMLHDPELNWIVLEELEHAGVPPRLLRLEITESGVMENPRTAADIISRLKDLGVTMSVDDFGTGYSSLTLLRRMPVQELKIDRSFITDLLHDRRDESIVRSMIELGHALGMRVVAEGVETAETCARLAEFGCDEAQGFYLGEPVAAEKVAIAQPAG